MKETIIKSYKAFDSSLSCQGFQYEVGKEYEMDGHIECYERGFHACENPLEVFDNYDMLKSRFAEVEQSGTIDRSNCNSIVCSSRIKIKKELKLADILYVGIDWLKDITLPSWIKTDRSLSVIKTRKRLSKTSDESAQIGSSGYYTQIGSLGDYAQIASSGDVVKIVSFGDFAKIGSSGKFAKIDSTGSDSVIMCAGCQSKAKAKIGSWITLFEWEYSEEKHRYVPVCVKTEFVDGKKIKADTYYILKNRKFCEVTTE